VFFLKILEAIDLRQNKPLHPLFLENLQFSFVKTIKSLVFEKT